MSFKSDIVGACKDLERLTGSQTFTWRGTIEILCTPSMLLAGTQLDTGGHFEEIAFSLLVRLDRFLSADTTLFTADSTLMTASDDRPHPVAGMSLVFRGQSRRILRAVESSERGFYRLDLGSVNR